MDSHALIGRRFSMVENNARRKQIITRTLSDLISISPMLESMVRQDMQWRIAKPDTNIANLPDQ